MKSTVKESRNVSYEFVRQQHMRLDKFQLVARNPQAICEALDAHARQPSSSDARHAVTKLKKRK